ncbi:hypothetical protein DID96_35510 [Burkholderia sp. Bp8963]|uniref:hypothetical protein n=1 Tax=Burkholderia sp. Bp8963 TaxID=2184547 RepID=UPI000F5A7ACC|nr:hypothetical protein [Burkholderia sp. Bp8963]RQS59084.1 hypothetical protein DID96_35510 [Burkholderia sp. Bp8963]
MHREYGLQTDVLATIVTNTPVAPKRAGLLTVFATCTGYHGARYLMIRDDLSDRPPHILDADGRDVSADFRAWIDAIRPPLNV